MTSYNILLVIILFCMMWRLRRLVYLLDFYKSNPPPTLPGEEVKLDPKDDAYIGEKLENIKNGVRMV